MRWSTAAGVGIVVVVAAAIMVAAYVLLASAGVVGNTYSMPVIFDNAQGVTKGTEVRLAGVKIGEVANVDVYQGNRAKLILRIQQKYDIPNDAEIRLASSGLLTSPVVEIIPRRVGPPEKGLRIGKSPPTIDQLLPQGQELLTNLNKLSQTAQQFLGDPALQRNLRRSTANMAEISEQGKTIAANLNATSVTGRQIAAQFRMTTSRLDRTADLLQQTLAENRSKLGQTLTTVNDTLGAMQGLVEQLTTVVADPKVKGSLRNTLANVESATSNLAKISGSLEKLAGDPKLNEDLRATVSETRAAVTETRATMEDAHRLINRLNRVRIGGGRRSGTSEQQVEGTRERVRKPTVTVDFAQRSDPGRLNVDVNGYLPAAGGGFYRAGVNQLTDGNKLNLQMGRPMGHTWLRYGLYASDMGVGLDLGSPTHPQLSADLYGLNRVQLDVRGRARIGPALDLTLGVQSLFNRNAPTVGMTWRR